MNIKKASILAGVFGLCLSINALGYGAEVPAEIVGDGDKEAAVIKEKIETNSGDFASLKAELKAKHKAEQAELKAKQKAELEALKAKEKAEKEGLAAKKKAEKAVQEDDGKGGVEALDNTAVGNTVTGNPEATASETSNQGQPAQSTENSANTETPVAPPAPQLPYVLVDDNMGNLQLDNANKPVYDKYTLAERRNLGLNTYMPELTPYRNGKIAYLTFDDGPEDTNTPAILDILKAEGIKATFYVVGNQCYGAPSVLKRIFEEGHAIGNHTYSHDYDVLYPYVDNFLEELGKTERIVKEIVGVRPLIVRAPGGTYGMFTSAYYPALKAAGYVEHDWNVCIDDAVGGHPLAWEFVQKVREQTASGISSAIVLMHSTYGKGETVRALPEIIQLLRDRGYSFGVMTPMTPQPW